MKLNYKSEEVFTKDYGDIIPLVEFIDLCESGSFIDYDGFAGELLYEGKVIYKGMMLPSVILENKKYLLRQNKKKGKIDVVWYNR